MNNNEMIIEKLDATFSRKLNLIAKRERNSHIEKIVNDFINCGFLIDKLFDTANKGQFTLNINLTDYLTTTYDQLNMDCIYTREDDKIIAELIKNTVKNKYGLHCEISFNEFKGELLTILTFCFHDLVLGGNNEE